MSQFRIKRRANYDEIMARDWMQELDVDARNIQAVLGRMDVIASTALADLEAGRRIDAALRMAEIREGVRLVSKLMGVKLVV